MKSSMEVHNCRFEDKEDGGGGAKPLGLARERRNDSASISKRETVASNAFFTANSTPPIVTITTYEESRRDKVSVEQKITRFPSSASSSSSSMHHLLPPPEVTQSSPQLVSPSPPPPMTNPPFWRPLRGAEEQKQEEEASTRSTPELAAAASAGSSKKRSEFQVVAGGGGRGMDEQEENRNVESAFPQISRSVLI